MTYIDFHRKLRQFAEKAPSDESACRLLEQQTRRLGTPVTRLNIRRHLDGTYRDIKLSVLNVMLQAMEGEQ